MRRDDDPMPPADDPDPPDVPPGPPGPPNPSVATAPKRIVCEFCGCALAPTGQVLRRGDAAKRMMDAEDRIAKLEGDNLILTEDRDRQRMAAEEWKSRAQGSASPKRSWSFLD